MGTYHYRLIVATHSSWQIRTRVLIVWWIAVELGYRKINCKEINVKRKW
jgi:hypothetical protein